MRSVLVVEDDPLVRQLVRRVLASSFDVTAVAGCGEASRLLGSDWRFDVLLLDLHLSDGDAADVFEQFRSLDAGAERRVVIMIGGSYTEADHDFLGRVPDALVLLKPFSRIDLATLVHLAGTRAVAPSARTEALRTARAMVEQLPSSRHTRS